MSTFVQFALDPRHPERALRQRQRFHDWVTAAGNPAADSVVLVEPNPWLVEDLRSLWEVWSNVTIVEATTHTTVGPTSTSARFFRALADTPAFASMGPHESSVRRRFPNCDVEAQVVPRIALTEVLRNLPEHEPTLVCVDGLGPDLAALAVSPMLEHVAGVAVVLDRPSRTARIPQPGCLKRLTQRGLMLAGPMWGESGETSLLRREASVVGKARAVTSESRMRLGQAWVSARDSWLRPALRERARQRIETVVNPHRSTRDVLDPHPGDSIQPPSPDLAESLLPEWDLMPTREMAIAEPWVDDPWALAKACKERHGVWPISFSYPRPPRPITDQPDLLVSLITPGFPYSFDDEQAYIDAYARAYWGVTHRKAGWDCFRHVEILASGAVPLMIDAAEIPRFSMVHYPKSAMSQAMGAFRREPRRPDESTREAFRSFFERHLTSRAMASYVLKAAGLQDAQHVLFVDERLPHAADYQSVLTLIGLKQLLGERCQVMHPVDYLYEDTAVDTGSLYGRGFGYTRVLPSSSRSDSERRGGVSSLGSFQGVDAIVVGSVARNEGVAFDLLRSVSPNRTIWIHGEDSPPTVDDLVRYRRSGAHLFVRSIHAKG